MTNGMTGGSDDLSLVGRFKVGDRVLFGRLKEDKVEYLGEASDPDRLPDPEAARASGGDLPESTPVSKAQFLAPCHDRHRIFAVALNYAPHVAETGNEPPEKPIFFFKPASAFVGLDSPLDLNPDYTKRYDYEGEIAVVIGRRCRNLSPEEALSCVYGVTALMDGSARDLLRVPAGQKVYLDWMSSKGYEGASAMGPAIACGEPIRKALKERSIGVRTRLNDEVVQEGSLADLIFSVEDLLVFLSRIMTLLPGDVVATGTPGGVGNARGRLLQSGDRLAIEVSHLPTLANRVA